MRVLLTGSTGFVGSAIYSHLANQGHEVIGVHLHRGNRNSVNEAKHVICDIRLPTAVMALSEQLKPCQAIIHASASLDMSPFSMDVLQVNCLGVQNILKLASQWKSDRFIFLSSLPVIGEPTQLPITEDHPMVPGTVYHASKLFGEHLVRLANRQDLRGVSLRLTAPIGPGLPKKRLLSVLVSQALKGESIELSGSGSRRQNYVDVRDIASAAELSLNGNMAGIFNIASEESVSNLALAEKCIKLCGSLSKITFNGLPDPEEGFNWDVSIEKAKREMGYSPRYALDQSIQSVMDEARIEN